VESIDSEDGTVVVALPEGDTAAAGQALLDAARTAGPVEHFARLERRLSEVFREAVGRPLESAHQPEQERVG
jgi:hypothetical protein